MAAGWSVMDALNKNSKAAAEDKPKARFRTRDISIRKMYSNDKNFYSMQDIDKLAQDIMMCGMIENLTVVYAPCDRGEYRIIAGERRWRALTMLVEKGYSEFEIATCQIKTLEEEHEEMVQIIMANAYRDKTVVDILEEEKQLKESLQYMRDNGMTLHGYRLDSGRLRDVIAQIMNTTPTKIAQVESINKRLIPEFSQELKEGRLTFSAAYELSGMQEERQQDMMKKYKENGLTWKEVKEAKAEAEEEAKKEQIEGNTALENYEELEEPDGQQADPEEGSYEQDVEDLEGEWQQAHRYDEEQKEIDRKTRERMRERQQDEAMQNLPSDEKKEKILRISPEMYKNIKSGQIPYMIVKEGTDSYREKDIITLLLFKDGKDIGEQLRVCVTCVDNAETSSGIVEGYAVIGVMDIYDAEGHGMIDLGDEE